MILVHSTNLSKPCSLYPWSIDHWVDGESDEIEDVNDDFDKSQEDVRHHRHVEQEQVVFFLVI